MLVGDPLVELRSVIGARRIPAYRVSSARLVRCRRTGYRHPYWGVAVYELSNNGYGLPMVSCVRPARRERSRRHLAEQDAWLAAAATGGVVIRRRSGILTPDEAVDVLSQLGQTAKA